MRTAALWAVVAMTIGVVGTAQAQPYTKGNDTGGIITYAPGLDRGAYHQMAANWCARWGRLSHVTSMHRIYGDYVGFVCIDRPWMIH